MASEYIERDEAMELLSQPITMSMCLSVDECHNKRAQQHIDRYLIENIPSADVRPVVLCRDCKHFQQFRAHDGFCQIDGMLWNNDFFCANGKREES